MAIYTVGTLTNETKTFYDMRLLERALPELIHSQFGQSRPIPPNQGINIQFRKFASLPAATTALTEGTPPSASTLTISTVAATVSQYGEKRRTQILSEYREYLNRRHFMPLHDDPMQAALYGYLAGILDGEGTFTIARTDRADCQNPSYNAKVCAGMTEREPMAMLHAVFGGTLRLGKTDGLWRWSICGRLAVLEALPILIPYLVAKKSQARRLMTFCLDFEDMRSRPEAVKTPEFQRREAAYVELVNMHKRDVAAAETKREDATYGEAIVRALGKPKELAEMTNRP